MAANEYYNSFNGGTPTMTGARPAGSNVNYAPSATGTAPPPYQEYHPHGFPPTAQLPAHQPQQQQQHNQQYPYNIADFKHNYDPNIQYGPSTPPPQHAYPAPHSPHVHYTPQLQHSQAHLPHTQQPQSHIQQTQYPPPQPPRPTQAYKPSLKPQPQSQNYNNQQRPGRHLGITNISTTNLPRPQRSSSEPPSPYYDHRERERERRSGHNHPTQPSERRRKHHHRSRSRSHSREHPLERTRHARHQSTRDLSSTKPKNDEKKTFLGAIGGSVVGDLIFPGLGTIGGAVLGGWGGHEAAKKQKEKEERERERAYSGGRDRERRGGRRSYDDERDSGRRRRGDY